MSKIQIKLNTMCGFYKWNWNVKNIGNFSLIKKIITNSTKNIVETSKEIKEAQSHRCEGKKYFEPWRN